MRALRVGIVSRTATYWPLYLAEREGLFARQGLSVVLVDLGRTSAGLPALAAGAVDIAATCPDVVVEAADRGEPVRIGGGLADLPLSSLVARPVIPDVAALRGRRVAVTEPRGSVSLFLRAALRAAGLAPGDYLSVVSGTTPAQVAALERGEVDAAMLTAPHDARAVASGLRRLAHVGDLLGPCAFTTYNVRRGATADTSWAAFAAALEDAGALLREPGARAEAIAALGAGTGLAGTALDDAYASCVAERNVFARGTALDPGALARMLVFMRADGLSAASDDLEAYVDAPGAATGQR
ncbi:MAG TPA: ABC transporter substrate-binding protein [Candidatus Limnocylindria bacterium]|nr:ABC transporter substrate-binding protein [Candidatus Limnocylindria bacterium]